MKGEGEVMILVVMRVREARKGFGGRCGGEGKGVRMENITVKGKRRLKTGLRWLRLIK